MKLKQQDLLEKLKQDIANEGGVLELSVKRYADLFGVKGQTIQRHVKELNNKNLIKILPEPGNYNRFRLSVPDGSIESVEVSEPSDSTSNSSIDALYQMHYQLEEKEKAKKNKPSKKNQEVELPAQVEETPNTITQEDETGSVHENTLFEEERYNEQENVETVEEKDESLSKKYTDFQKEILSVYKPEEILNEMFADRTLTDTQVAELAQPKKSEPVEKPFTLDDKIEEFIKRSKDIHDPSTLLNHNDREIVSVLNETLNQNLLYMKDLSDQLSIVDDKEMITSLIDERNNHLIQMKTMEEELESTRNKLKEEQDNNHIDPARIRMMQQIIMSTLDNYVNLPNQSIAFKRKDFRDQISKEIKDLVDYAIGIEN